MTTRMMKGLAWLAAASLILNAVLLAAAVVLLQRVSDDLRGIRGDISSTSYLNTKLASDVERVRAEVVAIRAATPCAISPDTPIREALAHKQAGCR